MYTENKPRCMGIKEFRGTIKSTISLPVIVQSDGEDVFAVVSFAMLRELVDMVKAGRGGPCPYCGKPAQGS